jgi:hypothetical protein
MHVNQRVICVNDKNQFGFGKNVVAGEIYTIRGFSPVTTGVYLKEIYLDEMRPNVERAFLVSRFRELNDDFADEVLEKINKEAVNELIGVEEVRTSQGEIVNS